MIHTTIGLYADRAMFVDGKCVDKGYLTIEEVEAFEERIKLENLKTDKWTAPYI